MSKLGGLMTQSCFASLVTEYNKDTRCLAYAYEIYPSGKKGALRYSGQIQNCSNIHGEFEAFNCVMERCSNYSDITLISRCVWAERTVKKPSIRLRHYESRALELCKDKTVTFETYAKDEKCQALDKLIGEAKFLSKAPGAYLPAGGARSTAERTNYYCTVECYAKIGRARYSITRVAKGQRETTKWYEMSLAGLNSDTVYLHCAIRAAELSTAAGDSARIVANCKSVYLPFSASEKWNPTKNLPLVEKLKEFAKTGIEFAKPNEEEKERLKKIKTVPDIYQANAETTTDSEKGSI